MAPAPTPEQIIDELRRDNATLRERLQSNEETLRAIRNGEVDSLVVNTPDGPSIFTLTDANVAYRTFVEAMQHGAATLSQDGIVLFCNQSLPVLLRTSAELVVGTAWRSFVEEDSWETFQTLLDRASTGTANAESKLKAADGTLIPVSISANPLSVEGIDATCLVITDLTIRRSSEQQLRDTLALQQAILDNADRSIISSSPDGIIQVFNRAAERMLGYTADEMVGRQTPAVFHDAEEIALRAKDLSQELGRTVEPGYDVFVTKPNLGVVEEREWTYVRKDQSHFPALLSVTAFRDSNGTITGYLGIANDITEQKRVEEDLREAKHAAQDANKAKSEFLANMSHEIRTPMNGIIGMTKLALATPLRPDQKEYLDTIKESGDALLTVINDILDFSKVEAGKFDLEEIAFNLPHKLDSAIQALFARAQEKGLTLICDLDPAVPTWISGDPGRLRQVIVNLVGNAIKFTERGEVVLRVTMDEPSGADQTCLVHFAVSDTGIGIPLEKQRIIFDPFSQADNSTTRRFGGTGLGLTISSRIVGLMGGKIWVKSEVGQGSTFHFTSRFKVLSKGVEAAPVPPSAAPCAQGLRILVAEDNAINRLVATRILELAGQSVVVVENGQEALSALEKAVFDIVLMDVQMPVMDGFEATALIRAKEKTSGKHMPIVAMTAHAMKGDRELCLGAGMDGYVSKPIEEQDLFCAIESAIAGVRQLVTEETGHTEEVHGMTATTDVLEHDSIQNDEAFERELAQIFLEDVPQYLNDIREAVTAHNGPALMLAAQSLMSSARILKDERAAEAALRMEKVGRDVDWRHAAEASVVLTREMTRLSAAMIDLTTGGKSTPNIELPLQALIVSSAPLPTAV